MHPHPFMVSDLVGTSMAVAIFSLVLFAPGYALGRTLDLFGFRKRTPPARAAYAVCLSIGFAPLAAYLLEHYASALTLPVFALIGVLFPALVWRDRAAAFSRESLGLAFRRGWPFIAMVAAWMALTVLVLVDLQIGDRLYFPSVTHDYTVRAAITAAITRTGVPPATPFFYSGHPATLRYHYFWFILCSIVERLGGGFVSPRQAMLAGTAWAGAGMACLVAICSQYFAATDRPRSDRTLLIALALLGVTGLDIVPVLLIDVTQHGFLPSVEWWNEPVMSWANAALWVPHHVAGLIACMTGYLLIAWASARPLWRHRIAPALLAGAFFAGGAGLTVYVTLTFAVSLVVWMAVCLVRKRPTQPALIALSGIAAIVVSMPYLRELTAQAPSNAGGHSLPLLLAVRPLRLADLVFGVTSLSGLRANLLNLAFLPLNYTLELGFFLWAGIVCCRRMGRNRAHLSEGERAGLTLGATSMVFCTFVRSSVIESNDLGMRGFMIAQLILLLWGAELLAGRLSPAGRNAAVIALVLGAMGSCYEVAMVRFYPLLLDTTSARISYPWVSHDGHMGARTYALREIYEELKAATPAGAILQHNPDVSPEDPFHGMYADRQVVAETQDCTVTFGGDARLCPDRIEPIREIFDGPGAGPAAARLDDVCARLSIGVLVVRDTDRVWGDRTGWVWTRTPMFANTYARAFACGASSSIPTAISRAPSR